MAQTDGNNKNHSKYSMFPSIILLVSQCLFKADQPEPDQSDAHLSEAHLLDVCSTALRMTFMEEAGSGMKSWSGSILTPAERCGDDNKKPQLSLTTKYIPTGKCSISRKDYIPKHARDLQDSTSSKLPSDEMVTVGDDCNEENGLQKPPEQK
ncbi:hypothetical protein GE061_004585 [Apolygus lucorum]|uniref:Uncharacterized protein n=1 Tax=Apolygus lucorum TaxID=248454 RepID=A0A8S9WZP5_APOLU|nr:hypothetical protein GE061_004585 [Apolygus lucorum]